MEFLATLSAMPSALSLGHVALFLLLVGGGALVLPAIAARGGRSEVRRRMRVGEKSKPGMKPVRRTASREVRDRAAKSAHDFYARTDPENVARLRLRLIQAGYLDPRAVGNFFVIRFVTLFLGGLAAFVLVGLFGGKGGQIDSLAFIGIAGIIGYFTPGLVLARLVNRKMLEHRNGFPDFMDLMIVCADAGMSMEASIERVSRELAVTYPSLSQNLHLVTIELRAGRALEDALRALGDRLSLEEVRSFATLLQQSKELGTSLSGALRVFSDEMRHKRMSQAEEKAYALPAKMSVPVTVCILPVVLMIAIIPIIVKLTGAD